MVCVVVVVGASGGVGTRTGDSTDFVVVVVIRDDSGFTGRGADGFLVSGLGAGGGNEMCANSDVLLEETEASVLRGTFFLGIAFSES